MNPQSRTILVLVLLGGGSVVALGWLAGRYGALLQQGGAPPPVSAQRVEGDSTAAPGQRQRSEQALAEVGAFIRVRSELRRAIHPEGDGPPGRVDRAALPGLLELRARALVDAGMERGQYLRVRGVYRDWRRKQLRAGEPLALALERNRAQLEAIDLGPYEALDL